MQNTKFTEAHRRWTQIVNVHDFCSLYPLIPFFFSQPSASHKFTSFKVNVSEWCCHLRKNAWNCCQSLGFLERLSRFHVRNPGIHHIIESPLFLDWNMFALLFSHHVFFFQIEDMTQLFSSFEVSKEVKTGGGVEKASMHFRWLMQFCSVLALMIRLEEGLEREAASNTTTLKIEAGTWFHQKLCTENLGRPVVVAHLLMMVQLLFLP